MTLLNNNTEAKSVAANTAVDDAVDYVVNKAMDDLKALVSPEGEGMDEFARLPVVIDGTVGKQLWAFMKQKGTIDEDLEARYLSTEPNLILGALRMLYEDLSPEALEEMIDYSQRDRAAEPTT